MPTHYLYGTVLTAEAVAANNRGDNIGNTTTLQKVFVGDDLHTSVSAEAIRFALRYRFQLQDEKAVNRTFDVRENKLAYVNEDRTTWGTDGGLFVDDDLMGFMTAKAAKDEQEAETAPDNAEPESGGGKKPRSKPKTKGTTSKRTSPLSVGRAVSLRPYRGEVSFNCVSGQKEKGSLSLYAAEMHTTEYQYSFGLNLGDVVSKANIVHLIDAIIDPPAVAGNHSRFAYDFSPASLILRLSSCHSSRIQNCFEHDERSRGYSISRLLHKIEAGDLPVSEIIVGGMVAPTAAGDRLRSLGVTVFDGVIAAASEAKVRIARLGEAFAVIGRTGEAR